MIVCAARVPSVPLPPLARLEQSDADDTESWRQSGRISGSVTLVEREFIATLARAGWRPAKKIAIGRGAGRSALTLLVKADTEILLMIWEIRAGMCGFSWGYSS